MAHWPKLAYAEYEGPAEKWFAWRPVRAWNDRWIWLRTVSRRAAVVHMYLDPNGGGVFWVYSAPPPNDP